jgi:hypothetical protein
MAIYHASVKVFSRSSGASSVAAAAYRAGSKLDDLRRGVTHDYSRKSGVNDSHILLPKGAPAWASVREHLWNAVEASENRKDAQLCRELEVALPIELDKKAQRNLVISFAKKIFVEQGMVADIALHNLDGHNPHAHIMLTMRRFNEGAFGKKERAWNEKSLLLKWRNDWADWTNKALEQAGSLERIDARSYAEREIKQIATKHLGKSAAAMEKRGIKTNLGNRNRKIGLINRSFVSLSSKITQTLRFKSLMQPANKFNDWAERAYSSFRMAQRHGDQSLLDWLGAGYWMLIRKKLKKELLKESESRLPSNWVESYSTFVDLEGGDLVGEVRFLAAALGKASVDHRIKQKFYSSNIGSPAGTVVSIECKEEDMVNVKKLIDAAKGRLNRKVQENVIDIKRKPRRR